MLELLIKFQKDFAHYLTRPLGLEAVMRVRATRVCCFFEGVFDSWKGFSWYRFFFSFHGLAMHTFHGHFVVRSADLLTLANVSPDNSYAFHINVGDVHFLNRRKNGNH
jgi:protein transport protein SEC24